jgi:hypothetical protein
VAPAVPGAPSHHLTLEFSLGSLATAQSSAARARWGHLLGQIGPDEVGLQLFNPILRGWTYCHRHIEAVPAYRKWGIASATRSGDVKVKSDANPFGSHWRGCFESRKRFR